MVLVVDKYRPKSFTDLNVHSNINGDLKSLVKFKFELFCKRNFRVVPVKNCHTSYFMGREALVK